MGTSIRSQLFRVIDTETTGLDPRADAIVELAWAIMRGDGTVLSADSTLINPGRPIPSYASTIHPPFHPALAGTRGLPEPILPAVCHNASFDSAFLGRSQRFARANPRFLCTLRLAENLIPECESYQLEYLRSYLSTDRPVETSATHRATNDVNTPFFLLKHLIDRYLAGTRRNDIEGLFETAIIQRMPFGRHKGELLREVPAGPVGRPSVGLRGQISSGRAG